MSIKMQSRHTVTPLISLMHYLKENQRLSVKKGEFDHTEYDRNVLSVAQITVFFILKLDYKHLSLSLYIFCIKCVSNM